MAMTECRECGEEVSSKAKSCPHCGVKNPGKKKQEGIGWGPGYAIIVVLMIVGGLFYEDEPPRCVPEAFLDFVVITCHN